MDKELKQKLDLIPNKSRNINFNISFAKVKAINAKKRSKTIMNVVISIFIAMVFVFPFYILLTNSFKDLPTIQNDRLSLPKSLKTDNYSNSIKVLDFFVAAKNSLILTIISNVLIIFISAGGAWMMVRTNSKLGKTIYTIFIFSLIVPFQILMIPIVWWTDMIGLKGIGGMIILYLGLGVPLTTFLLHGFIKGIPSSIEEAAIIDGAGTLKIFFKLIIPLLKPIILTVLILNTIWIWNDFLLPFLILSKDEDKTIVLKIKTLQGQFSNNYPLMMASLMMALIPALIFFFFTQKGIISGMTQGANK